ncbi:MAG: hypothetical protein R3C32_01650 [Chloroflexota bacterium]
MTQGLRPVRDRFVPTVVTAHTGDHEHRSGHPVAICAAALLATGLRKSYGDTVVLDDVDLEVAAGRSTRSWARTAQASPRSSRSCRGS